MLYMLVHVAEYRKVVCSWCNGWCWFLRAKAATAFSPS